MRGCLLLCIALLGILRLSAQPVALVIDLKGEINPSSARLVISGLEEAQAEKASVVILHLNTYGGLVSSADTIRTRLLNSPIPTVAFIDKNAGSAGALISIACNRIYMSNGASIGAATVVNGQNGEAMPDKYQSYMRGVMRATAIARNRNPLIAEKMVDQNLDLPGISPKGQVITFTPDEAQKNGFSDGDAANLAQVLDKYGLKNATVKTYENDWTEALIQFLLLPAVSTALMLIIFAGIFLEMKAPGLSIPGLVSFLAAMLYFAPHYLEGLAEIWEMALFFAGVALLGIEIFLIPGFGLFGILGVLFTILGLTFGVLNNDGTDFSGINWRQVVNHMAISILAMGAAVVGVIWLGRYILTGNRAYPIVDQSAITSKAVDLSLQALVGHEAVSQTDLRPTGYLNYQGQRLEAQTRGEYVPTNTPVRIIGMEGGTLVVERVIQA
jgi:membrane-bound serine protease (ClpP class)